jgi:7,8-dihydropterin-6-yl-methyl-4-(beta-D-ribofuranosyl)aminobenzene 5'-phosphate synthase
LNADKNVSNNPITITILYDNYVFAKGTQAGWGFSSLIENTEKTILFDTGYNPDILMKNVKELNKDLSQIDAVVISHNHRDHSGGLFEVLRTAKDIDVYLPNSTPNTYLESIKDTGVSVFCKKDFSQICSNVYLLGELGDNVREQPLILDTDNGLVILTGCSHPGILNIVRAAKDLLDKEVYMVCGGFHLMEQPSDKIREIIKELDHLGVQKCCATHCTGAEAIQLLKQAFGENFIQIGTGKIIEIVPTS